MSVKIGAVLLTILLNILAQLAIAYMYSSSPGKRFKTENTRSALFLFLILFLHPSTSVAIFNLFSCRKVEGFAKPYFLTVDYGVNCFDHTWWIFTIPALCFGVLYTFGLPIWFFARLYQLRGRIALRNEEELKKQAEIIKARDEGRLYDKDGNKVQGSLDFEP